MCKKIFISVQSLTEKITQKRKKNNVKFSIQNTKFLTKQTRISEEDIHFFAFRDAFIKEKIIFNSLNKK